jgi:hypothetical protein
MNNVSDMLDDIDCLVPLITYLGANPYWWARSAPSIGIELGLNPEHVQNIFERYPMIFRKSKYIKEEKSHSYALQMRYAQRADGKTDELSEVSYFPVLSEAQIISLIEFLVKISNLGVTMNSMKKTTIISVIASVASATTAIIVAFISHGIG